jgi:hypothetical protein
VRRFGIASVVDVALLLALVAGFLGLLGYYGDTLLPITPDETTFLQPAEGLATGQGMGTPILDGLLPGIDQRTYWQPPGYFLVLALWGKVFGFEPLSARWLSRVLGVIGLLLLWRLALRWGVPKGTAWLCVLWTALDLTYQYGANLTRMDILNAVLVLVVLWAFTVAWERNELGMLGLAGVGMAAATLTHLIALPLAIGLALFAKRRWGWRGVSVFLFPLALGGALWAVYIAQDVGSFVAQMGAQFARKAMFADRPFWLSVLFTQGIFGVFGVFGVFPTNAPLSLPFVALCLYAAWRHRALPQWQAVALTLAYIAAALGGEIWYVGWFTPFGYLAIAVAGREIAKAAPKWRAWLVAFGLLWAGFQTWQVAHAVAAVPALRADTHHYFAELAQRLPAKAVIVLHSIPDPAFFLRRHRPDLRLYELSPTPMPEGALARLRAQKPFFVGVPRWLKAHKVCGSEQFQPLGVWNFRVGTQRYQLVLARCHP